MRLIGLKCTHSDMFSLQVLIGRGLFLLFQFVFAFCVLSLSCFFKCFLVGVDSKEVPPVPIPNTEVKLFSAYNTWLVTTWEDWTMPTPSFLQGSSSFGSCLVFVFLHFFSTHHSHPLLGPLAQLVRAPGS